MQFLTSIVIGSLQLWLYLAYRLELCRGDIRKLLSYTIPPISEIITIGQF
nr:MAG TPA: hypothetical protein [Caudoviricetes sp.]